MRPSSVRKRRFRWAFAAPAANGTTMSDDRVLVYSTDGSLPLPAAKRRAASAPAKNAPPDDGTVRVFREKRRASMVTLVHGLTAAEIETEGKALRRRCGTGGTTKNGVVELQGDHRDAIVAHYSAAGRRVKKAGG
jgi:translation initiation factor 1